MSSIRNCLGIEHIWRGFGYLSSEERRKWSNNGEAREDIARWHWMSQRSDPTLTSGRTSPFKIIILYNLSTTNNWYEVQTEDWVDLNWLDCLHCPMPIHTYCAGLILVKVSCRLGEVWLAKSPPRCHHSLTFDRGLFHLTGWMRAEGVPFTKFGHILCRGCSVVTPPTPPLVQSRQIKWAEQFLRGLAMSKGPNRPTLNPTQMKITEFQNSVHNVSRRQTVFSF